VVESPIRRPDFDNLKFIFDLIQFFEDAFLILKNLVELLGGESVFRRNRTAQQKETHHPRASPEILCDHRIPPPLFCFENQKSTAASAQQAETSPASIPAGSEGSGIFIARKKMSVSFRPKRKATIGNPSRTKNFIEI
jgi:hypothetical protein